MQIFQFEQGTKDWHDARRCRIGGTRLEAVMGTPAARQSLIAELIAEEATEQSKTIRPTAEMERGTAEEVFAIKEFEKSRGISVTRVGMCVSDEFSWLFYSPDGLILQNGECSAGVEVKSPDTKTAVLYMMLAKGETSGFKNIPKTYQWQVVQSFLVNKDQKTLHFIIYDARFINDEKKLYVIEVSRDDEDLIAAMEKARSSLIEFRKEWLTWRDRILPSNF